jgi:hypothetical protein
MLTFLLLPVLVDLPEPETLRLVAQVPVERVDIELLSGLFPVAVAQSNHHFQLH